MNARIAICGIISRHKTDNANFGPENYANLIFKRASMEGFIVIDFMSEADTARKKLKEWISDGKIKCKEDIQEGFFQKFLLLMTQNFQALLGST